MPAPHHGELAERLNPDQLEAVVHGDGPAAGRRRGRLGQDAGAHPPHRPPDPRAGRQPLRDPGHHLHQQGRRRDAASGSGRWWAGGREDVGVARSTRRACASCGATPAALGYPSNFTIYDQADAQRLTGYVIRDLGLDPKKFTARGVHAAISAAKNDLVLPDEYAERAPAHLRAQDRRRLPRVPGPPAQGRRHGLRRPAHGHRAAVPHLPRRARALPAALRARPGRRVPGHQPGPERARAAARPPSTATSASWATATSRSTGLRGADMRNILEFERRSPTSPRSCSSRTTARTQTILDAANAVIANNSRRKPKKLWTDPGRRQAIIRYHADDEGDEAQWVAHDDRRPPRRRRPPVGRRRRLLPHQRPEPGGGGGAHARRHPLQGRRAARGSTTGGRSRTPWPT